MLFLKKMLFNLPNTTLYYDTTMNISNNVSYYLKPPDLNISEMKIISIFK